MSEKDHDKEKKDDHGHDVEKPPKPPEHDDPRKSHPKPHKTGNRG